MIGLDTIHEVGPGGNYLTEDHTLKHFRTEIWRPRLLNRDNPDTWREKGSLRYEDVVIAKTLEILETHQPEQLPAEVQTIINNVLQRAEEGLKDIQFMA